MAEQLTSMRGAFGNMPARARLAILGVAAVTILVMFLVVRTATATHWVAVAENLPADKLGEAQKSLEEAGIDNRVNDARTAIEVPEAMQPKAASALMTAGIAAKGARADCAKQSQQGGSIMAKTSAEFDLMLETCRENQVANDIEGLDGVQSASVDVSMPSSTIFASEEEDAKASVIVHTGGSSLPKKTVDGIQKTVASRFEGMQPASVTVADETGKVLGGEGDEGEVTASMAKLDAEAKMNQKVEAELGSQLEKIVGVGNVVLKSNIELDMDQIDRAVHQVEAAGENGEQLVKGEDGNRELLDGGTGTGTQGVAGVGGQTDVNESGTDTDNRTTTTDPQGTTGSGEGDYVNDKYNRLYDNNVIEEAIKVAPGSVKKNRLSVVVDDGVDAASADSVKEFVQAYMGGNADDSLSFSQAKLAIADETKSKAAAGASTDIAGYVKWALLGLGLIGMAFVMRSSLRQRTADLLAPADDLLLLESGDFTPIPIAELEAALAAGEPSAERRSRIEMQKKVEKIAENKPQDIANELRRWMHQDDMAYSKQRKAG